MSTFPPQAWRKSSYSERKYCVEVAQASGLVAIRDSKDPEYSVAVTTAQWRAFLGVIKHDRFWLLLRYRAFMTPI